jgi:hypothetical protein
MLDFKDYIAESGGKVVFKSGKNHIEKYGEFSYAVYHDGKKKTFYKSLEDAKSKLQECIEDDFDLIEEVIEDLAYAHNLNSEYIWEQFEEFTDEELLEYAIDAKGHKSSTGGMTQKGVDAYNRKTGGNLKTAVTTPPSKLKPGSKAAKRRKSFCARMGGMPGAMKDDNGKPTRKALALRKWNC